MKLDVAQVLREPGIFYPFDVAQAIAPQQVLGDTVTFEDAHLWGELMAEEGGNILVKGQLATCAHSPCANCLTPASVQLHSEFEEEFILGGDPEDDDIFVYTGRQLDLERLALTYAMLALPMRILCKKGCASRPDNSRAQGVDVIEQARYSEAQTQRPFAALQQLLDNSERQDN